jgi:hypothetical protein
MVRARCVAARELTMAGRCCLIIRSSTSSSARFVRPAPASSATVCCVVRDFWAVLSLQHMAEEARKMKSALEKQVRGAKATHKLTLHRRRAQGEEKRKAGVEGYVTASVTSNIPHHLPAATAGTEQSASHKPLPRGSTAHARGQSRTQAELNAAARRSRAKSRPRAPTAVVVPVPSPLVEASGSQESFASQRSRGKSVGKPAPKARK